MRPPGPMFLQRSKKEKSKAKKKTFDKVEKKKLLSLGKEMKKRIVGQDEPVDLIVDAVQRAKAGLRLEDHPIGSFIFTGETGIGKTETAKVLAEELIGERAGLISIDCSEYTQDHEYAKLIGSPPGYVGHDDGGVLTNAMMSQPFRIVLFDEFDKASNKMYDLMLQVLDEGRLTDGKGKKVSFKDAIVIFTANLGVREIERAKKPLGFQQDPTFTEEKKRNALETALKRTFRPEFLNRIDNIVHFKTLTEENYYDIIDLLFNDVQKLLDKKKIILKTAKSIKKHIYEEGIDTKYGARPLERAIKKIVSTPLARKIIKDDVKNGATVLVKHEKGEVKFNITNPKKKKEKKDEKND
jgi:ATP-dependent Clp protease ATP-binding subunit ClpC